MDPRVSVPPILRVIPRISRRLNTVCVEMNAEPTIEYGLG